MTRAVSTALAALLVAATAAACSSSSNAPDCTGAGQGGKCTDSRDCKPTACKCLDGTGSDEAFDRVCDNGVCDAQSACDLNCRTHGGVDKFTVCS